MAKFLVLLLQLVQLLEIHVLALVGRSNRSDALLGIWDDSALGSDFDLLLLLFLLLLEHVLGLRISILIDELLELASLVVEVNQVSRSHFVVEIIGLIDGILLLIDKHRWQSTVLEDLLEDL